MGQEGPPTAPPSSSQAVKKRRATVNEELKSLVETHFPYLNYQQVASPNFDMDLLNNEHVEKDARAKIKHRRRQVLQKRKTTNEGKKRRRKQGKLDQAAYKLHRCKLKKMTTLEERYQHSMRQDVSVLFQILACYTASLVNFEKIHGRKNALLIQKRFHIIQEEALEAKHPWPQPNSSATAPESPTPKPPEVTPPSLPSQLPSHEPMELRRRRRGPDPEPDAIRKQIDAANESGKGLRNTEASLKWMTKSTTELDVSHMMRCNGQTRPRPITLEPRNK